MNEDLFPGTHSLSPKLEWLKKHKLKTWFTANLGEGEDGAPWACCKEEDADKGDIHPDNCGVGATEEEAIISYCQIARLPHFSLTP